MTLWQRFTAWRRSRPFWGGLLAALAGVEIIASTKMTLDGATLSVGINGFQALLIPLMLVLAGLLAWFTPAQRMFYGLIAVFVATYSLLAVNLGGWFVGTLLGIAGGGLIFAWNPADGDPAGDGEPESGDDGDQHADMDGLLDGPMTDTLPPAANPLRDGVPAPRQPAEDQTAADERHHGGPRHAAMVIAVATLTASALSLVVAQQPARAADCGTQSTARTGPVREVVGGILDAVGGLLGADQASPSPAASPEPCPSPEEPDPSPTGGPKPSASPKPEPSSSPEPSGSPMPSGSPAPSGSDSPEPSGSPTPSPAPTLKAARGQQAVAERPGLMTGSRVSMVGLTFDGIVELPTKDGGTVRTLRFSMDRSDTNDFRLRVYGKDGAVTDITTPRLTVAGDRVYFYTSRFRGKALGVLDVDYTPDAPPVLTPPLVFFTDPVIDLVYVDSPELRAPDMKIVEHTI
ncbi:DUF6114 domain-containing protein [Catellatospora chokoriensis]|uniref:Uncharacterized protein n=1 Tax=Catellatospora chokoriensis TaxID=310353 RepID=A0A8J3K4W4_9ACTN|nr:DUF6114 domain-containing protein [Catellatospora chokoriensis]GIF92707.1 hypothetical protein Cch02nite_61510 [Catellatospora chokoriensis]